MKKKIEKKKIKYKFLRLDRGKIKSEYSDCYWKIGEWKKIDGQLEMCKNGYHCSSTILDALSWIAGEILAIVETRGESIKEKDKECWEEMKIVKAYRWTASDSIALANYMSKFVQNKFEILLNTTTEYYYRHVLMSISNLVMEFKELVEQKIIDKINKWLVNHLKELEEIKG